MRTILDFERPVGELEKKLEELRTLSAAGEGASIGDEISRLESKATQALEDLYANLSPWQKTQVARHPERPHFSDYASRLFTEFTPFAGGFASAGCRRGGAPSANRLDTGGRAASEYLRAAISPDLMGRA